MRYGIIPLAFAVLASPAPACPFCDTKTGRQVRAGIFDDNFAAGATAVVLPFAVAAGIAAFIHFAPRRGRTKHGQR